MGVKNLPYVCFDSVIVEPVKDGYEGIFDPYIPDEFYTPKPVNRKLLYNLFFSLVKLFVCLVMDLYGGIECYPDEESNAEYNLMMKKLMRSGKGLN